LENLKKLLDFLPSPYKERARATLCSIEGGRGGVGFSFATYNGGKDFVGYVKIQLLHPTINRVQKLWEKCPELFSGRFRGGDMISVESFILEYSFRDTSKWRCLKKLVNILENLPPPEWFI